MTPSGPPAELDFRVLALGMSWSDGSVGHGSDRYFACLADVLTRAGVPLTGLVTGDGRVTLQSGGCVRAVAEPSQNLFARRRAFASAIADVASTSEDPLVVASHFAAYARPLGRLPCDASHVVHFHGPWADESAAEGAGPASVFAKRWLEKRVYRSADRLITLSQAFADTLVERYVVDPSLVRVIPGGVEYERFAVEASREAARERLGFPLDRPVVVCVRRLSRRMGLDRLIDAMARVVESEPDVLLCLAGSGPLKDALAEQVRSLSLEQNVRLLGFVPDDILPLLYRSADLSVVPSQALEGFGLITLESLAAGVPVLVAPIGGLPETVSALEPGLVLTSSDAGDIADGLIAALSGQMKLPDTEACRQYARDGFDWPVIADRVLAVYREALASRG